MFKEPSFFPFPPFAGSYSIVLPTPSLCHAFKVKIRFHQTTYVASLLEVQSFIGYLNIYYPEWKIDVFLLKYLATFLFFNSIAK